MVAGVGLALFYRNREQFFHYLSVISFLFYVCYLIYIFTAGRGAAHFLPGNRGLSLAGRCAACGSTDLPGRDSGRVILPDHGVDLSHVRGAGRRVSQQSHRGLHRHTLFLLPVSAFDSLAALGRSGPPLPGDDLLPVPLRGGCPGWRRNGSGVDSHREPAPLQIQEGGGVRTSR